MRILLDEPVPRRLGTLLVGHEATTAPRSGWAGIKNGKLLTLAAAKFDAFVTTDRNIEFQQNLSALPIPCPRLLLVSRFAIAANAPMGSFIDLEKADHALTTTHVEAV